MVAVTDLLKSPASRSGLRPFDVRRDLGRVADLVEQCFSDTLDPDGQHYLGQMRAAAGNPAYLRLAGAAAERVPLPLSGYVWEDDGRIVGNLTLIPFNNRGRRFYLIANVAVHPDYRRRGIARSLTSRAIEHARRRSAESVWLHVREENAGAVKLYRSLGFSERTRRTTWNSDARLNSSWKYQPGANPPTRPRLEIGPRYPSHWPAQQAWLRQLHPPELSWHLSINMTALRPGLVAGLYRFITDARVRQWSVRLRDRLFGVLAYQSRPSYADTLWLAVSPELEDLAASTLLLHARRVLPSRRPLSLEYPAGRAVNAIQEAGFHIHQTLIWMSMSLDSGS